MNSDIPIPPSMAHLPRDHRGYPIPATVLIDKNGKPQFTVNEHSVVTRLVQQDRCHICGWALHRARWFVGGPLSAFHKRGRYNDGPMHRECMRYALKVCPYLAAPNWTRALDDRPLSDGQARIMVKTTMMPGRPPVFVAVMVHAAKFEFEPANGWYSFAPRRPYLNIEYWRDGIKLSDRDGRAIVQEHVVKPLPTLRPAEFYVKT